MAAPTPDRSKICTLPIAPALSNTSPPRSIAQSASLVIPFFKYSTPRQFLVIGSIFSLVTTASVSTVRLLRLEASLKNALEVFKRQPAR